MGRKVLVVCIDGFGPEYFKLTPMPNLDYMVNSGGMIVGDSVVPTVTNVNNVSIITGKLPKYHGITSNYWVDRDREKEVYMESAEFLCCGTVLEKAKNKGLKTALLTSKKKLLNLLDRGSDYSLSAEDPPPDIVSKLGMAPDIYSPEINHWLFKALKVVLSEKNPDIIYCSTTDGPMHKFPPEDERSIYHLRKLDELLGKIVEENPQLQVYVTADHGMSYKSRGIDLQKALKRKGLKARCLPVIKDSYIVHHQNLGGASYVFSEKSTGVAEVASALAEIRGVEKVYRREDACNEFGLMPDRVGDILVLGERDVVFGEFGSIEVDVSVRSHGSMYERRVPIIGYPDFPENCTNNFDITASLEF